MKNAFLNLIGITKQPDLASEVINSASRILLAAGFTVDDIKRLFHQAAEQMKDDKRIDIDLDISDTEDEAYDGAERYNLIAKYEQLPEVMKLDRLAKRASVINTIEDDETLQKAEKLLREAIPLRRQALASLNTLVVNPQFRVQPIS